MRRWTVCVALVLVGLSACSSPVVDGRAPAAELRDEGVARVSSAMASVGLDAHTTLGGGPYACDDGGVYHSSGWLLTGAEPVGQVTDRLARSLGDRFVTVVEEAANSERDMWVLRSEELTLRLVAGQAAVSVYADTGCGSSG